MLRVRAPWGSRGTQTSVTELGVDSALQNCARSRRARAMVLQLLLRLLIRLAESAEREYVPLLVLLLLEGVGGLTDCTLKV